MDLARLEANLKQRGFGCAIFADKESALAYLDGKIDATTVGIGGSMTAQQLQLYERLSTHNTVAWHMLPGGKIEDANHAEVYISSLNALAETGELINIDGVGNRVSATSYGKKRIFFIVGQNKLAPDFEKALWRARNIAAPKNAARLGAKTPCVMDEPRCHDCKSPERICKELLVLWQKPRPVKEMEIIFICENLGY